jgi:nucleoside-diphosphate-sugar epimerase
VYGSSPENVRWAAAGEHLLTVFRTAGGRRAVLAGSCAEYDWSAVGVCDERSSPLAGANGAAATPYAEAKLALHAALSGPCGAQLSSAWGRLFFQYGPGEHPRRLIASVIGHLLRGEPALCTHGRQIRSFLHVADVGDAFAALLDSGVEGPVNIGSGEPVAIAAVLAEIGAQIGRPELIKLGALPAPPAEPPLLIPAVARLTGEVGWRPRFSLPAGLADSIQWWRAVIAAAS